jgi:hypothetical protein
VAREVVEAYGDKIPEHPVGTGPFRLAQWRRSRRSCWSATPATASVLYDAEPAADDAEGQAILARTARAGACRWSTAWRCQIIEEAQPRWLSFLNGQIDFIGGAAGVRQRGHAGRQAGAQPGRQGIQGCTARLPRLTRSPSSTWRTRWSAATRRTRWRCAAPSGLAMDVEREIRLVRRGPGRPGAEPGDARTPAATTRLRSENGDYNPAAAKALLDLYGYVDRDGDGWRELPDGQPLVHRWPPQPEQLSRQFDELWKQEPATPSACGASSTRKWPENLKAARAGKLHDVALGSTATGPTASRRCSACTARRPAGQNLARFKLPAFDAIYEQPSAARRPRARGAVREAKRMAVAYMPYKVHVHRIANDLAWPWVIGYRRPLFWHDWWHMVDVDTARPRPMGPWLSGAHLLARPPLLAAAGGLARRAAAGAAPPRRAGDDGADAARPCAWPSRRPRPRSTRPQTNSDQYLVLHARTSSSAAVLRLPGAAVALQPLTAAACPRSRPTAVLHGAHPAGHLLCRRPGLQGPPRELVAQDYVYSAQALYDPRWNSSDLYLYESLKLPGLSELRERRWRRAALRLRHRSKACARWTATRCASRWACPTRASSTCWPPADMGAVAREVVEFYGDDIGAHPVGTGPFR